MREGRRGKTLPGDLRADDGEVGKKTGSPGPQVRAGRKTNQVERREGNGKEGKRDDVRGKNAFAVGDYRAPRMKKESRDRKDLKGKFRVKAESEGSKRARSEVGGDERRSSKRKKEDGNKEESFDLHRKAPREGTTRGEKAP